MVAIAESLIAVIKQVMAVILEHAYVPCTPCWRQSDLPEAAIRLASVPHDDL
jgi:hypothetical protein